MLTEKKYVYLYKEHSISISCLLWVFFITLHALFLNIRLPAEKLLYHHYKSLVPMCVSFYASFWIIRGIVVFLYVRLTVMPEWTVHVLWRLLEPFLSNHHWRQDMDIAFLLALRDERCRLRWASSYYMNPFKNTLLARNGVVFKPKFYQIWTAFIW